MIKQKKYFLCVLLCTTLYTHTMDKQTNDEYARYLRGIIDGSLLGITPNTWYTRVLGALASYCKTIGLSAEQAHKEIEKIEFFFPSDINKKDREEIFTELNNRHWYVYYLIDILIKEKIKEFENVTGYTIDNLYKPEFPNDKIGRKKIVYDHVARAFFINSGIKRSIELIPFQSLGDIHFKVLYGHNTTIQPDSLIMSSDGKYLQSTDYHDKTITWDMKHGIQVTLSDDHNKTIAWQSGYTPSYTRFMVIDQTNHYYAISAAVADIPVYIDADKPAIILCQRPTKASHLCQRAFEKNKDECGALRALQQSRCFQAIEGFPKDNLHKLLTQRIQQQDKL